MSIFGESQLNGYPILIELVAVPGSEETGLDDVVVDRVSELFARARDVVAGVADQLQHLVSEAAEANTPDQIEVEIGLSLSVDGRLVLLSASAGATMGVKLTYDRRRRAAPARS